MDYAKDDYGVSHVQSEYYALIDHARSKYCALRSHLMLVNKYFILPPSIFMLSFIGKYQKDACKYSVKVHVHLMTRRHGWDRTAFS